MPDYQQGKIYTIRSYQTDAIYIGSTTQSLAARLGGHRRDYNRYIKGKHHYGSSFKLIELDDHYIELLDDFPCNCKEQLLKREGECIRAAENCVNRCIPGRTNKEYNQDHAGKIKEFQKVYWQKNAERLNETRRKRNAANREAINAKRRAYRAAKKAEAKKAAANMIEEE